MTTLHKTLLALLTAIVVLFGAYAMTHQQATVSFGDGISFGTIYTAPTNASSTATTTSTLIVSTSTSRNYFSITNDGQGLLYIAIGQQAVIGKGIRLAPSQTFEMKQGQNMFSGSVYGIATSSTNVSYVESTKQ